MYIGDPVRCVVRFIRLLRELNLNGPMSIAQIVLATGMPHPTAARMVKTMLLHELVEPVPGTRRFRVAAMALSLSSGFQQPNRLAAAARPTIETLTQMIGWPVVITTRVGMSMIVRASTHHLTSLTFGPCPDGTSVPIEHSASGHVFLAHASRLEQDGIIGGLQRFGSHSSMTSLLTQGHSLERIRADGFATYERNAYGAHPGKTSAISVPIVHDGVLQGTLTLLFFASAMPVQEALRRYLDVLQKATKTIACALDRFGVAASNGEPSRPAVDGGGVPRSSTTQRMPVSRTQGEDRARDAASAFADLVTIEQLKQIARKRSSPPRQLPY